MSVFYPPPPVGAVHVEFKEDRCQFCHLICNHITFRTSHALTYLCTQCHMFSQTSDPDWVIPMCDCDDCERKNHRKRFKKSRGWK